MRDEVNGARQLLAEALEIDPAALEGTSSIDNTERWDSIAHMRVILAVEAQLGRALGPSEVAGVFSLEDISHLLQVDASPA